MDVGNFYGAGLKHAYVKDADGNEIDIFAIIGASGDREQDELEIKGDDEVKGIIISGSKETFTIEANGVSFEVIQMITGNSAASSSTGSDIALGTDSELNPPYVEIGCLTNAKSSDGTASTLLKIWHKAQLKAVKVEQAGETEFKFTAEGLAVPTDDDIEGNALESNRIATLKAYAGAVEE